MMARESILILTIEVFQLYIGPARQRSKLFQRLPPQQSNKSRALGALLGMVVGDALGAPLGGQELLCYGLTVEKTLKQSWEIERKHCLMFDIC